MMFVALLMRAWICTMKTFVVMPRVLADDVLIVAAGVDMLRKHAHALNQTHIYLQAVGARVAPTKISNFASCTKAKCELAHGGRP